MKIITIRVPTKVTFFGEHGVVYGTHAIASTIPVYIDISGKLNKDSYNIVLNIKHGLQLTINNFLISKKNINEVKVEVEPEHVKKILNYVLTAISICEEVLDVNKSRYGYIITIDSPLPIGVGLGTSASVSVGISSLCLLLNDYIKNIEDHKYDIAKLAWSVEKSVQGSASPMDTYTISLGGLRYIDPLTLDAYTIETDYDMPIIIGYTNKTSSTTELIQKVRKIKEKNNRIFNSILSVIENIVNEAKEAFIKKDVESLGMLMNINHGLLRSLGVVDNRHDMLIHILREAGALGAKTSGAGGGGAFIALAPSKEIQERLIILLESLGAKIVSRSLYPNGVTFLKND